jgi:hypothetical protein
MEFLLEKENPRNLGTDIGYRFTQTKAWEQGTKACTANGSNHMCDMVGHHLSPWSGRSSRVVFWRVFHLSRLSLSHKY